MAAIDKMYLDWYDFSDLKVWSIIHYPKLFDYMIYPFISRQEFFEIAKAQRKRRKEIVIMNYEELGYNKTEEDKARYSEVTAEDYLENYFEEKLPITNTSLKVDRWLFWHCPLDFVQEYLTEQCGYKVKWYHKIWRMLFWHNNF